LDYVKSRKPLFEADLKSIDESARRFIAIDFFDSGVQIDESIKGKIFNPFFSTKNQFDLGLAISKEAAGRTGGRLEEPRAEEVGKSFRMLMPKNILSGTSLNEKKQNKRGESFLLL